MYIHGLTINRYGILGEQTQHRLLSRNPSTPPGSRGRVRRAVRIELFLRLEYSVEFLIEYPSTRLIPEVAVNYRTAHNKQSPGSSFKRVIQQFEMRQNNAM